jgi:hypothetical protein
MNQRISLQELVAINNTPKAKALLVKYGYKPARSYNDLIKKLTIFTREHREDALKELVEIHPHKDLILNYQSVSDSEKKSNCEGDKICPKCMAREQFMNFDGTATPVNQATQNTNQNTTPTNQNESSSNNFKAMLPMIAITSLVTASLVILISRKG